MRARGKPLQVGDAEETHSRRRRRRRIGRRLKSGHMKLVSAHMKTLQVCTHQVSTQAHEHTSTRVSILGDELRVQGVGFSSVFRLQKAEYNITTPSLVAFLQNDHWWSFFKLI